MTSSITQLYNQAVTGNIPQDIGLGGFKLYAAIATQVEYDSEAPVSYLEDGSTVTDHLVREPIILTIAGNVSDVFLDEGLAPGIENLVRRTQGEIGVVTKYLPARSHATTQQINSIISDVTDAYSALDSYYNEGEQLYSFFGDKTDITPQSQFFEFIEKTRNAKALINVQTRYRTYNNMAMISVTPGIDNQNYATSFTMRLQEIRFAKTDMVKSSASKSAAKGVGGDTESEIDKGDQSGSTPTSLLYTLTHSARLTKNAAN